MPRRRPVALDGGDRTVAEEPREQPDAGVEVEHRLPRPRREERQDGVDQHLGRAGVHLPEALRRDGELDTAHPMGRRLGRLEQAPVDRHDVVRAVLAHPLPAVTEVDVALPGAPAEAAGVARDGLHRDVDVEPGEPLQLLADDVRLQPPLPVEGHVLEVAATARVRSGVGAGRRDPVGVGGQHLDGVGPPEPVAVGALGDLQHHPLAGQGVPHEHGAAVDPRHAVTAVGHRPDLDLEPLPHPRGAARRPGPRAPGLPPAHRHRGRLPDRRSST